MPGVRELPADPLPARLSERRSMPGRSTSALSKVETDSALERSRTKDVRRLTSPFAARVPVNAAGIRELGSPRFFRRPRVAGTIGKRSSPGTIDAARCRPPRTIRRILGNDCAMAVRAFHPILYVADPYAERDFFGRFGFETVYEGDDFPGFLAVECGPVCFGLSNNSDLPQTVAHDGVVRLTSGPRLS